MEEKSYSSPQGSEWRQVYDHNTDANGFGETALMCHEDISISKETSTLKKRATRMCQIEE